MESQIEDFMSGKYRIMLTTNLLSRGIDMRKVTMVINYDLPLRFFKDDRSRREVDVETYLHRVGRTGRFGDKGLAINLVDKENDSSLINDITKFYNSTITKINASDLGLLNDYLKKI